MFKEKKRNQIGKRKKTILGDHMYFNSSFRDLDDTVRQV
jgi:hypothetical protein